MMSGRQCGNTGASHQCFHAGVQLKSFTFFVVLCCLFVFQGRNLFLRMPVNTYSVIIQSAHRSANTVSEITDKGLTGL